MASLYKDTDFYILQKTYLGRRLQRVTQCTTEKCLDHYHDVLKRLEKKEEDRKFLKAIFAKTMTVDQVVALWDSGDRKSAVTYEKVIKLFHQSPKPKKKDGEWKEDGDVYHWLNTTKRPASEDTKKRYRRCFRNLSKLRPIAKLHELPELLQHYREVCEKRDVPVEFRNTKAACQSYVSKRQGGKYSPLWNKIAGIPAIPHEADRTPHFMSPKNAFKIAAKLPAKVRPAFWMVLLTGMRPMSEYEKKKWTVKDNHIHMAKSKTPKRVIPLVLLPGHFENFPSELPCSRDYFSRQMAQLGFTIWDLRNSYVKILLEQLDNKIPHHFIQHYCGHKSQKDMTTFYARVEGDDADTMQQIMGHAQIIYEHLWKGKKTGRFKDTLDPNEMPDEEKEAYGDDI